MATFAMVEIPGSPGSYLNLDLVRVILPSGSGSIVVFDDDHTIGVNMPPGNLASGLMKKPNRDI
jgi:hypothetical protein